MVVVGLFASPSGAYIARQRSSNGEGGKRLDDAGQAVLFRRGLNPGILKGAGIGSAGGSGRLRRAGSRYAVQFAVRMHVLKPGFYFPGFLPNFNGGMSSQQDKSRRAWESGQSISLTMARRHVYKPRKTLAFHLQKKTVKKRGNLGCQ